MTAAERLVPPIQKHYGQIAWPAQCECGHLYLERFQWPIPRENGAIGFSWCGFCRTRRDKFPKFAETSCSQCGAQFGPGDWGYSHCEDHK